LKPDGANGASMVEEQKSVLVVDDESAVRDLMQALLRNFGFRVVTAEAGQDALEKMEIQPIDLVLTDFLMPGMTGAELAREIKRRRPELPIVLITGHQPECISSDFAAVLAKPFSRDKLWTTVAALI
jgi:CheY-like chemotaxis protein